jgi:hypothetical protein
MEKEEDNNDEYKDLYNFVNNCRDVNKVDQRIKQYIELMDDDLENINNHSVR